MVELVAKRYGQALYELAIESGQLADRESEVNNVLDAFKNEPDFSLILSHPNISKEEKIAMVETVFSGKVSENLIGFLALAIQKGREDNIIDILNYVLVKISEHRGFVTAYIISATPLTETDIEVITKKLESQTGKKIAIEAQVDKSLIGGLRIRINDRIVDNSIKTSLHKMARDVYEANV